MTSFRRRNALALHELHYGPNMTPMVDVVMVILVFFMASAAVLGPEWWLRAAIPKPAPAAAATDDTTVRLAVALSVSGGITSARVNDEDPVAMDVLEPRLARDAAPAAPDNLVVLVSAEPDVPYDDVVRVHELCAKLGIKKVGLWDKTAPAP